MGDFGREAVRRHQEKIYSDGITAGVEMALDHIEGKPGVEGVVYVGPLPDELKDYIAEVRQNLEKT